MNDDIPGEKERPEPGEQPPKPRKKYTITRRRKYWTQAEHERFLEAYAAHPRQWQAITAHVQTRDAVQVRSHAQKYFLRVERDRNQAYKATRRSNASADTELYIERNKPSSNDIPEARFRHGIELSPTQTTSSTEKLTYFNLPSKPLPIDRFEILQDQTGVPDLRKPNFRNIYELFATILDPTRVGPPSSFQVERLSRNETQRSAVAMLGQNLLSNLSSPKVLTKAVNDYLSQVQAATGVSRSA